MKYSAKVNDHFFNPRNVGDIPDADAVGKAKNPADGDVAQIFAKIKGDRIQKITFRTMGCVAAIAASSKFTEMAKDKTIQEALQIDKIQLSEALGGLTPNKMNCSLTCIEAFKQAIDEYKRQQSPS